MTQSATAVREPRPTGRAKTRHRAAARLTPLAPPSVVAAAVAALCDVQIDTTRGMQRTVLVLAEMHRTRRPVREAAQAAVAWAHAQTTTCTCRAAVGLATQLRHSVRAELM